MNILFIYIENVSFLNSGDKYNKFPIKKWRSIICSMFNSPSGKMQLQIKPERGNDGKNIMKNAKYPI